MLDTIQYKGLVNRGWIYVVVGWALLFILIGTSYRLVCFIPVIVWLCDIGMTLFKYRKQKIKSYY